MFHRAVMMSGSSLHNWTLSLVAVRRTFRLGQLLGCPTQDPQQLLEFLQNVPVFELVKLQTAVFTEQVR